MFIYIHVELQHQPREEGEEILGPEYPYLSLIGALMYLTNSSKPDIAFAMNLLSTHSVAPTNPIGLEANIWTLDYFSKDPRLQSSWIYGCWLHVWSSQSQITERVHLPSWRNDYFMEII